MITAKKQFLSNFFTFAVGACLHALSYSQSAITTTQRVQAATIEILFAKNKDEIWDLKMASEAIFSPLI